MPGEFGRPTPTVVLVHGAFHGAWCWDPVRAALDERGIANVAMDLPFGGLSADAGAVAAVLDTVAGPSIVCGHSYGGIVISRAASGREDVVHLVYLCAVHVEDDTELDAIAQPDNLTKHLIFGDNGVLSIDLAFAVDTFFHDCDTETAADAVARLRPTDLGADGPSDAVPAWKTIPSTYVVCTDDHALAPAAQRVMAKHANASVEWHTSHSPMLSQPRLVADLLGDLATTLARDHRPANSARFRDEC